MAQKWENIRDEIFDQIDQQGASFLRLVFHDCFTYHKDFKFNSLPLGAGGAAVRFLTEGAASQLTQNLSQNKGLKPPILYLKEVKKKFPETSLADLIVFAATFAIRRFGGPLIPFRPGRTDHTKEQVDALVVYYRQRYDDWISSEGAKRFSDKEAARKVFGYKYDDFIMPTPNISNFLERICQEKFGNLFTLEDYITLTGSHTLGGTKFFPNKNKRFTWNNVRNDFSNAFYKTLFQDTWTMGISDQQNGGQNIWTSTEPNVNHVMFETDIWISQHPTAVGLLSNSKEELKRLSDFGRVYIDNQQKFFDDLVVTFQRLVNTGWTLQNPIDININIVQQPQFRTIKISKKEGFVENGADPSGFYISHPTGSNKDVFQREGDCSLLYWHKIGNDIGNWRFAGPVAIHATNPNHPNYGNGMNFVGQNIPKANKWIGPFDHYNIVAGMQ